MAEIRRAIRQLTWRKQRAFRRRASGLLAYWLYALGLTSGFRILLGKAPRRLLSILDSAPWPLPRPPQRFWASDASSIAMAVVDQRANVVWARAAPESWHIYKSELFALCVAIALAPPATAVATDSAALYFGPKRSSRASRLLLGTSVTALKKNIRVFWVPSKCNPAVAPSRVQHHTPHIAQPHDW